MTLLDKAKNLVHIHGNVEENEPIKFYVSTSSNQWNKLAIEIVKEGMKPPTQRTYSTFITTEISTNKSNLTTNDWNKLALSLVESDRSNQSKS